MSISSDNSTIEALAFLFDALHEHAPSDEQVYFIGCSWYGGGVDNQYFWEGPIDFGQFTLGSDHRFIVWDGPNITIDSRLGTSESPTVFPVQIVRFEAALGPASVGAGEYLRIISIPHEQVEVDHPESITYSDIEFSFESVEQFGLFGSSGPFDKYHP